MEGRRIYVKHPSYKSKDLSHSGTKGMHWGERLYQYKDGSLTPLGRIHYGIGQARVKRAEEQAKNNEEREKRKYQNSDGTLKLRGKLHYKTLDKYALLTDDEIKQRTSRLQLQKNLEDIKKQTSRAYRLQNKLGDAIEDLTVSGFKRGAEKIVNSLVDKGVSKLLKTDEENVTKAREFAEKFGALKTNQIEAINRRRKAESTAYENEFGSKPPKDYKYTDLTDEEKKGLGMIKEEKPSKSNENDSPKPETKTESAKPENNSSKSETKPESSNPKKEAEGVANIKKPLMKEYTKESKKEVEGVANIKKPSMKEYDDKPVARVHRVDLDVNKKKPLMKELEDDDDEKKKKDKK